MRKELSANNRFIYLLEKINQTEVIKDPFEFLYIENFIDQESFFEIISLKEFNTKGKSFHDLKKSFANHYWEKQAHPGTFGSMKDYEIWRRKNKFNESDIQGFTANDLCEAGGIAFRLKKLPPLIKDLVELFHSSQFEECIRKKFGILDVPIKIDTGIQKYLTGYEISPHPDTREKALTWMLNLNTEQQVNQNYHTQFLKLKKDYEYIYSIWNSNSKIQRHWLPWSWCETVFKQNANNSISIFSPSNYSLHGVKARYNDLNHQRTQLYGNFWYQKEFAKYRSLSYKDFDFVNISREKFKKNTTFLKKASNKIKQILKYKILNN